MPGRRDFLKKAGSLVREFSSQFSQYHREKATGMLEYELRELENVFALLLCSSFVGLPAPPLSLSVELLPFLKQELKMLHLRAESGFDSLAELSGIFEI